MKIYEFFKRIKRHSDRYERIQGRIQKLQDRRANLLAEIFPLSEIYGEEVKKKTELARQVGRMIAEIDLTAVQIERRMSKLSAMEDKLSLICGVFSRAYELYERVFKDEKRKESNVRGEMGYIELGRD